MTAVSRPVPATRPDIAWSLLALIGVVAPLAAMLVIARGPSGELSPPVIGPILAIALMAGAMIAASATGRLVTGVMLALAIGVGLAVLALALGAPVLAQWLAIGLALVIATISFAARGFLFSRSIPGGRGWAMAVFVVAGEAAIILTALAKPGALPDWLLALLPAQWASSAIRTGLEGGGILAPWAPLLALAVTAAATLLAAHMLPRRLPYTIMFTTWLLASALVYTNA